ncbi:MAG TPA: polyprenyl synthetase family protein [Jatrophihabitans sp.]|nr:polyprenyl synthetase family protein [Jatrophihabitans sp.]
MTTVVSPALESSMDGFRTAMQAAVGRMDPHMAAVSAYHLGWATADGTPELTGSGKGVRPALALLSAQAAGAPAELGIDAAVAVELVHNFSLLHDDVMDGDTQRRHRPTVWSLWGVPTAILAGDAMLTIAQEVLLDSDSPHRLPALRMLLAATRELIRGQVEDLEFETAQEVTVQQCRQMVAGKTGALLAASASLGCVLAGGDQRVVDALSDYGYRLGTAFQLVDDLLGIWGDPVVTGKPVLSDLRSRKRSLPISYAACQPGPAGQAVSRWLHAGQPSTEQELARIAEQVAATGAQTWATDEAARQVEQAEAALATAPIDRQVKRELSMLAQFVIRRDF